jgi:hypothetical protein
VTLECFNGVEGTRWRVSAGRRPAVSKSLIHPHTSTQQTRDRTHRRSPSRVLGSGRRSVAIVVCSVAGDQSSIGAVTRIRWSPPGRPGGVWSKSARTARKRRFARFLTTAFPTERGIANAKRGRLPVSGRTTSRIGPRPRRVPSAWSRANARWPVSRSITPTSGRGPSDDEHGERHGRLGCSSVTGTRASWHVCERWAGRDASFAESFMCCRSRCGSTEVACPGDKPEVSTQ